MAIESSHINSSSRQIFTDTVKATLGFLTFAAAGVYHVASAPIHKLGKGHREMLIGLSDEVVSWRKTISNDKVTYTANPSPDARIILEIEDRKSGAVSLKVTHDGQTIHFQKQQNHLLPSEAKVIYKLRWSAEEKSAHQVRTPSESIEAN